MPGQLFVYVSNKHFICTKARQALEINVHVNGTVVNGTLVCPSYLQECRVSYNIVAVHDTDLSDRGVIGSCQLVYIYIMRTYDRYACMYAYTHTHTTLASIGPHLFVIIISGVIFVRSGSTTFAYILCIQIIYAMQRLFIYCIYIMYQCMLSLAGHKAHIQTFLCFPSSTKLAKIPSLNSLLGICVTHARTHARWQSFNMK